MEISYQKPPFTQASRQYNKLLKPDSLQRIPTPLNLCVHQTFISTFNHAISQQQILLSRRSTDAGICCSVHEVTLQKYRSSQQSIITSLIVVIGAIALKIMALLNQNMNHAIAFCTGNMSHTTHNTIINLIWNIAVDVKGCLCTQ